ncbi:twin-arginine translocase subunit TatA [Chromatium okenii]|uniref:twin-arginine translocase TatA/TatE family subunit n=1 Tax=Chromatium okenii TaxID=61644 RepID=UPI0019053F0B|nr:twin-arginine translocase TatA/TatE family subunit [Chromatium okenii]MBK1642551.1 twin-arginine translocase subunit TatA [Chromatium okenii]
MGLGGISIWQLLIILAIIVVLFGTSRLKNIGSDLGSAIRGFRNSMANGEKEDDAPAAPAASVHPAADANATAKPNPLDKDRDTAARS